MSKKNTGTAAGLLIAAALGACVAMAVTVIICALGASLIAAERAGESSIGFVSVIALILSSSIGAFVALQKIGHHRLVMCIGTGAIYLLILLVSTAILFDGEYRALGTTALAVLGGSGCAALMGLRRDRPKPRRSKYHNMKLVQNRQTGN